MIRETLVLPAVIIKRFYFRSPPGKAYVGREVSVWFSKRNIPQVEGDSHPPYNPCSSVPESVGLWGKSGVTRPLAQTEPQAAQMGCEGLPWVPAKACSDLGAVLNAIKLKYPERRALLSLWGHFGCWCCLTEKWSLFHKIPGT